MNVKSLSAFDFALLPTDDLEYLVVDVYDVKIDNSSQPVWTVRLRCIDVHPTAPKYIDLKVHSEFLSYFALGNIFQNRKFNRTVFQPQKYNLSVSLEKQSIEFRAREAPLRMSTNRNSPADIPYAKVLLLDNEQAQFAFVRCYELIRFYFGSRHSILRNLFNFTDKGANPNLYDFSRTRQVGENEVSIYSRNDLLEADVPFLANYIFDPREPMAIAKPAISVRAQHQSSEFNTIQPLALAPLWFPSIWQVDGQLLEYEDGENQSQVGMMISRIDVCSANPIYDVLDSNPAPNKLSSNASKRWVRKTTLSLKRTPITTAPHGNDTEEVHQLSSSSFNTQPGYGEIEYTRQLHGGSPYETGSYEIASDVALDTVSTSRTGGNGNERTGKFSALYQNSGTANYEELTEPDRSHLPRLFSEFPAERLLPKVYTSVEAPPRIINLKHSAAYINENTEFHATISGDEREQLPANLYSAVEIPREWMRRDRSGVPHMGIGSILICSLNEDNFYFFELVKNYSKSHSLHGLYFPDIPQLSSKHLSKIFHQKLQAKKGWPKREDFSDDFYSYSMRHMKGDTIENFAGRMKDVIEQVFLRKVAA